MIGRVLVLVMVVLLALGGALAIQPQYQAAVEGANNATTVDNETVNTSTGVKQLAESNQDVVYQDTDAVVVRQNNTTYVASGNYTWYTSNGTIEILSSTTLDQNNTANVTYGYTVPGGEQELARDVGLLPAELGGALTSILGAVLLVGSMMVVVKEVAK